MNQIAAEEAGALNTMLDNQDFSDDLVEEHTIREEEDEPIIIMSDGTGQVCAPPAHLAARFYRDARRKSSAASSRRNSLSSTHSHGSSRSFRRGSSCQSHYIAQHLRRASIIESRKARLADRAAHAEQVRVRAALAKAAPRGNSTSSEERALAAQIARENHLAKVAAACAEEVQRAKQIAQEMKARKLEEEKKVRQDMEDRLAEADKRRAGYQRNIHMRRSRRASSQEKKLAVVVEDVDTDADGRSSQRPPQLLDEETAVRRIQRMWQTRRRKEIVDSFSGLELTMTGVGSKSFEDMGSVVTEARALKATSRILKLFGLQDEADARAMTSTRTFLSAYMILAHPQSVFSKNGAQEQDLITKARDLLEPFESAVVRLASWNRYSPSAIQLQELSQVHASYATAFEAWRTQDSSALVETMVASFVELDAIWQTVKDDSRGQAAEDYREGIRDNQVLLLSKIRKIASPDRADILIKKAIRESRRRRGRRRTAAEVRPRVADEQDETSEAAVSHVEAVAPFVQDEPEGGSDARSLASVFSPIPNNRVLTHELAINKDFRVGASAQSDVKDALNRKLCDSMREGVDQGDGATWTTAMAECIRAKLLRILKPGNSMYTLVNEALDPEHVYKQCDRGVFSYDRFFEFMASVLPKLCAPFRDDEVKALSSDLQSLTSDTGPMIEKLFRLLQFIDLLSLDYSNFLLMNAAPVLIRESAGYEQRMFAQDLESGVTTLQHTKRWWRNASVNLLTEADRRDPEQVRLPADRPTSHKIYSRGLVDLAVSQGRSVTSMWPETLHLDTERLLSIRRNALYLTAVGATLLTAKNLLKRDVRSQWKSESTRLWDLLTKDSSAGRLEPSTADDLASRAFVMLESAHNMPPSTKTNLQNAISRFFTQAASTRLADPVMKVLFQRLKTHIFVRVAATSSTERVRAASTASEALASSGLSEFGSQVAEIVDVLRTVAEVDWKSHGPWYDQIAGEMSAEGV